jgi:hypothetical protein
MICGDTDHGTKALKQQESSLREGFSADEAILQRSLLARALGLLRASQ